MGDAIDIEVHVRPGGRRDAVEGAHDGVLAVRVAAPPAGGRANVAVLRTLARAFRVKPASVLLVGGSSSRRKRVRISGDEEELTRRHRELLGEDADPD